MKKSLSLLSIILLTISCTLMFTSYVIADPPKVGSIVRVLYSNLGGDSYDNQASSFDMQHVRPYWKGAMLDGKLKYKLMFGFDKNFTSTNVLDAFGDFQLFKAMSVRFGQFKVPFDRQFLTPLTGLQFVNRGAGGLMAYKRDRGVMLHGAVTNLSVTYDVGIFNGTGISKGFTAKNAAGADEKQHLFAGRLTVNPQGSYGYKLALPGKADELKTTVGLGFATGQIDNDSTDVLAYCFDVTAHKNGITALFEYQNREVEVSNLKTTTTGMTGQAGYFISPQLEAVGRYSSKEIKDVDKTYGITVGVNYYFDSNNAKLQLNYTMLEKQPTIGDKLTDNKIYLLYQMIF